MFQREITVRTAALQKLGKEFEVFAGAYGTGGRATFEAIREYDWNCFRDLFIDSLFNKSCISDDVSAIKSDSNYIYFPVNANKVSEVTGIIDAEDCLYDCIVLPMFDTDHRKDVSETKFLDPEYDYSWKVYIKFSPEKFFNSGLNCFEFAVMIENKFYCNLSEETDLDLMKEFNYPHIEYVESKYEQFSKYAVSRAKRYIRENLFRGVYGEYLESALDENLYVQKIQQNEIQKNYVVGNYLNKIKNKERTKWYEIYDNLVIMSG